MPRGNAVSRAEGVRADDTTVHRVGGLVSSRILSQRCTWWSLVSPFPQITAQHSTRRHVTLLLSFPFLSSPTHNTSCHVMPCYATPFHPSMSTTSPVARLGSAVRPPSQHPTTHTWTYPFLLPLVLAADAWRGVWLFARWSWGAGVCRRVGRCCTGDEGRGRGLGVHWMSCRLRKSVCVCVYGDSVS